MITQALFGLGEHAAGIAEDGACLAGADLAPGDLLDLLDLAQRDRQRCLGWHLDVDVVQANGVGGEEVHADGTGDEGPDGTEEQRQHQQQGQPAMPQGLDQQADVAHLDPVGETLAVAVHP